MLLRRRALPPFPVVAACGGWDLLPFAPPDVDCPIGTTIRADDVSRRSERDGPLPARQLHDVMLGAQCRRVSRKGVIRGLPSVPKHGQSLPFRRIKLDFSVRTSLHTITRS